KVPERRGVGGLLSDVPPKVHPAGGTEGGKAAGLHVLCAAGARVPPFHTIGFAEIDRWQASGAFRDAAHAWVSKVGLAPDCLWAVRSSADVEDHEADPMSGSFASVLGCRPDEVPEAIERVAASAERPEIRRRLQSGRLHDIPRMAVV